MPGFVTSGVLQFYHKILKVEPQCAYWHRCMSSFKSVCKMFYATTIGLCECFVKFVSKEYGICKVRSVWHHAYLNLKNLLFKSCSFRKVYLGPMLTMELKEHDDEVVPYGPHGVKGTL